MRSIILIALFAAFVTITVAYPGDIIIYNKRHDVQQDQQHQESFIAEQPEIDHEHEHFRAKRGICDELSGFRAGSNACAENCIDKGFFGGRCTEQRFCNCRW